MLQVPSPVSRTAFFGSQGSARPVGIPCRSIQIEFPDTTPAQDVPLQPEVWLDAHEGKTHFYLGERIQHVAQENVLESLPFPPVDSTACQTVQFIYLKWRVYGQP